MESVGRRLETGIVGVSAAVLSLLLWRVANWLVTNDSLWIEAAKPVDVLLIAEGWNVVGLPVTAGLCIAFFLLMRRESALRERS